MSDLTASDLADSDLVFETFGSLAGAGWEAKQAVMGHKLQ
jgi:hypothetical protein